MVEPLVNEIIQCINQAADLYSRLILIVAPAGTNKTTALQMVHEQTKAPLVNLNLELSRRMLELTERQRALYLPRLLSAIMNEYPEEVILLDNIEILFEVSLKLDPLRLLQGISRNKTVVTAWSGSCDGEQITYAVPDHPEYRKYPIRDMLVVNPGTIA